MVVRGRVAEGKPPSGRHHRHRFTKGLSTAKAFLRGDVEHARVVVVDVASGKRAEGRTDDEGFYDVRLPGPLPAGPRTVRVALEGSKYRPDPVDIEVTVVDAASPGLLVICDIDDTLVDTGVTRGIGATVLETALRDAGDMRAYPAAAATLQAFAAGGAPIVYLSASPVELAPRLTQFLRDQGFPPGALMLRYYPDEGIGNPVGYKRARIDRLLGDFGGRKVVLVGDNGEHDPELFRQVATATGRVAAAYVRLTLASAPGDGLVGFHAWREVARDAGRRGLIRWMTAARIVTERAP